MFMHDCKGWAEDQMCKAKKEDCCEDFRERLCEEWPDDFVTTVISETGWVGVWCDGDLVDVHESIKRKKLGKKKWDSETMEENRKEYKEMLYGFMLGKRTAVAQAVLV